MKSIMLIGALGGFLLSLLLGLATGTTWPTALWHAAVAALAIGWLMRWWRWVWIRSLREAISQRLATLAAERQQNKATPPKKV